jgi:ribonuclease BN (tRNA processing enzyme)
MDTLIVPLGTRGWMPHQGRETMCTLVKRGSNNFLLDCGTGASRLLLPEVREILGRDPITILLSHFHLDHTVGLTYLSGLLSGSDQPVRLAGPRAGFIDFGLREACDQLTSAPLTSRHYRDFPFPVELIEFGPEGIEIDGVPIAISLQAHPGGSATIRIGDSVCYATDLAASMKELPLATGVDCLIHETWSMRTQAPDGSHSGLKEALDRAERAKAKSLIPTHFGLDMTETDIQSLSGFTNATFDVLVPNEGQPIRIACTQHAER